MDEDQQKLANNIFLSHNLDIKVRAELKQQLNDSDHRHDQFEMKFLLRTS
jgi:hypothetical protein